MKILQTRAACKVEKRQKRPLSLVQPHTPTKEAPLQAEEFMCWIAEAEQLNGIGRSPSLSLT